MKKTLSIIMLVLITHPGNVDGGPVAIEKASKPKIETPKEKQIREERERQQKETERQAREAREQEELRRKEELRRQEIERQEQKQAEKAEDKNQEKINNYVKANNNLEEAQLILKATLEGFNAAQSKLGSLQVEKAKQADIDKQKQIVDERQKALDKARNEVSKAKSSMNAALSEIPQAEQEKAKNKVKDQAYKAERALFTKVIDDLNKATKSYNEVLAQLESATKANRNSVISRFLKISQEYASAKEQFDTIKQIMPENIRGKAQENQQESLTGAQKGNLVKIATEDPQVLSDLLENQSTRDLMANDVLVSILDATRNNPNQQKNQIAIIEEFMGRKFTRISAEAVAVFITRLKTSLSEKETKVFMDAAAQMMQKKEIQFYGLAIAESMLQRKDVKKLDDATIKAMQPTIEEAYKQKVSFTQTIEGTKKVIMVGDVVMDTLAKGIEEPSIASVFYEALPSAVRYSTDIKKVDTWVREFSGKKDISKSMNQYFNILINMLNNTVLNTPENAKSMAKLTNQFISQADIFITNYEGQKTNEQLVLKYQDQIKQLEGLMRK